MLEFLAASGKDGRDSCLCSEGSARPLSTKQPQAGMIMHDIHGLLVYVTHILCRSYASGCLPVPSAEARPDPSDAYGTDVIALLHRALAVDVHAHVHAARGVDADFVQVRIHVSAMDVRLYGATTVQPLYKDYVPALILRLFQLLHPVRRSQSSSRDHPCLVMLGLLLVTEGNARCCQTEQAHLALWQSLQMTTHIRAVKKGAASEAQKGDVLVRSPFREQQDHDTTLHHGGCLWQLQVC